MSRIILICLLAILASSCKKDTNKSYYLACKIDGVETTFNFNASTIKGPIGSSPFMGLSGSTNGTNQRGVLSITIANRADQAPIRATTYTDATSGYELGATYLDLPNPATYFGGTFTNNEAQRVGAPLTNHFTLRITFLNEEEIKGTFSGDMFLEGDPKGSKISFTEGSFYLAIY